MDPLVDVNVLDEAADLTQGIGVVGILYQIDFLFFDGSHQPFHVRVLGRIPDVGDADPDACLVKPMDLAHRCVLNALIGVVDHWLPA